MCRRKGTWAPAPSSVCGEQSHRSLYGECTGQWVRSMKRQGHCSLRKGPVVWGFRVLVREGKDDRGAAVGQSVPTPKFIRLSLFAVTSGAPISCFPLTLHSQPSFLSCLVTSRPVSISRCISVSEFSGKKPESLHHVRSLSGPLRMSILPSFWHLIPCVCIHSNALLSTNNMRPAVWYTR